MGGPGSKGIPRALLWLGPRPVALDAVGFPWAGLSDTSKIPAGRYRLPPALTGEAPNGGVFESSLLLASFFSNFLIS